MKMHPHSSEGDVKSQ